MNNMRMMILAVMLLAVVACATQQPTGRATGTADVQTVTVHAEGASYIFTPSAVEVGRPVQLIFDTDRLPGCSRAFTIPSMNIGEVISEEQNTITFTPSESGSLVASCTMAMYNGELIVQ